MAPPAGHGVTLHAAFAGVRRVPPPVNEPINSYAPGTPQRAELKARLTSMAAEKIDIPLIIGGREIRTGNTHPVTMPHDHGHVLAEYHRADPEHVQQAIAASTAARREWAAWPWEDRAAVILRAAELLATTWRATLNASTMLGQSKTAFQSEIDAACEMIDFWRFNAAFAQELYGEQPISGPGVWNSMEYATSGVHLRRVAVHFTAIGGNLTTAPALMGTPSSGSNRTRDAQQLLHLQGAGGRGLPRASSTSCPATRPRSRINCSIRPSWPAFTSPRHTAVFGSCGRRWARHGATGPSASSAKRAARTSSSRTADPQKSPSRSRGAFMQGQKCSAASRTYIPQSLWSEVKDRTVAMMKEIKVGDVRDFRNFMGAVIDKKAFDKISEYLEDAKNNATVVQGGTAKGDKGYFIEPTLIETKDPGYRLLCEEIFGPVLTAYVYPDGQWEETLDIVDKTSPYALTGAIRARSAPRSARRRPRCATAPQLHQRQADRRGRQAAAVRRRPRVGTNDKAGSKLNLVRWASARTVKETLAPPRDYKYPFMAEE